MSFNSNFLSFNFDRNTFVGFDEKEIESSTNEDLLMIRKTIYHYLKSTNLKKRNANFMSVYYRINRELKARKVISNIDKVKLFNKQKKKVFFLIKTISSTKNLGKFSEVSSDSNSSSNEVTLSNDEKFLRKKTMIDVEIPSFFNDKILDRVRGKRKLCDNDNIKLLNINTSYSDNKFLLNKPGFTKTEQLDQLLCPVHQYDDDLKQLDIRFAMFNELTEDISFELD